MGGWRMGNKDEHQEENQSIRAVIFFAIGLVSMGIVAFVVYFSQSAMK